MNVYSSLTLVFFFRWQFFSSRKLAFYPIFKLLFYFVFLFVCLFIFFLICCCFLSLFLGQAIQWRLGVRVTISETWTLTRTALAFSWCRLGWTVLLTKFKSNSYFERSSISLLLSLVNKYVRYINCKCIFTRRDVKACTVT